MAYVEKDRRGFSIPKNPTRSDSQLDKKVPKSSKYAEVQGVVDSGFNMKKLGEIVDLNSVNARFRREEFFQRLRPLSFYHLVMASRDRVCLAADVDVPEFLLLDVREAVDFDKFHIEGARSFPHQNLSRAQNEFASIPEVYQFRNHDKRIIILYEYEERFSTQAGNKMVEKGFNNVFVLTGGIRKLLDDAPELIVGKEVPADAKPVSPPRAPLRKLSEGAAPLPSSRPPLPSGAMKKPTSAASSARFRTSADAYGKGLPRSCVASHSGSVAGSIVSVRTTVASDPSHVLRKIWQQMELCKQG